MFVTDSAGRVTGVYLEVQPVPSSLYELIRVDLIDEPTNGVGGPTVATFAVLDKNGLQTAERVWLAWPYPGLQDGKLLPGNAQNQHMITSVYHPPDVGPLAMYPGDAAGQPLGDICGGLGLPRGHHVSFRLTWRARGTTPPPPDDDDDDTSVHDYSLVLGRIAETLDRLAAHLGA